MNKSLGELSQRSSLRSEQTSKLNESFFLEGLKQKVGIFIETKKIFNPKIK